MHVIGTAGHVDHGKSALVERLTGIDPDRWEEEKRRGLTIDLGFAWLSLPSGGVAGIVDVPGHERFIKNMLAGAGGISICLFVVAANEGWKPQSTEHLAALHVLGVNTAVVALTKSDTVDREMLALAIDEVGEHLGGTRLENAPIVPCSAITGAGISELITALDTAVTSTPPPPDHGRPRLWIDRAFTISGAGTVVTGTLAGGRVTTGDMVEILGPKRGRRTAQARIRTIQSHKQHVVEIGPGNRVALNLAGLARPDATRGDAVVHPDDWQTTRLIDARVVVLDESISGHRNELTEKGSHLLYVGSAEVPVRLKLLNARRLQPGEEGFAQVSLRDDLPLARGDRFVLRDAGRVATFGGGEILDPLAGPARRDDSARIALLQALDGADEARALRAHVEAESSIDSALAFMKTGARSADGVIGLGSVLVSKARHDELLVALVSKVRDWHTRKPLERGIPQDRLRAELRLDAPAFEALLSRIDDVVSDRTIVRLAGHRVTLSDEQSRERDRLLNVLETAAFTPPMAGELDGDQSVLRSLVEAGEVVKIGSFYLSSNRAGQARALVRSQIETDGPITVAAIRDLLGTTRKYAVPLCEWLDQTGATLRRGDERILGPNP